MKMTRHNGRSGKHGTYNPKHNDRRFDIANSEHIDQERAKQNVYWDCYQGFHYPEDREKENSIVYSFEQIESDYYRDHYTAYCEAQHERNRKTGHSGRDRTPEDLLKDKKTCPEESLIQIGTMEQSVQPEVLTEVATEFFEEFNQRFGEHIHILDWSLHLDESTPHIHERHVFDCENRYGEIAPQQEKALEALGFDLPNPNQKPGKLNNRKMSFDAACRAMLFNICERHGLHLDQEPEYGGRTYLEKQDYILMKQKERINEQKTKLDDLSIQIEDKEKFIDEVSDKAYSAAVEAVADRVAEETHRAELKEIERLRAKLTSEKSAIPKHEKAVISKALHTVITKLKDMSKRITKMVIDHLEKPEIKLKLQEPVKESLREKFARFDREHEARDAARRAKQGQQPKKNHDDMEL
ncbi:MAG: serine/arginine repetitive matrix protein 2 [Oscillospiraceae bacterium]|nr:serine/arginine repetitive matrix protein 2 [Oscillospiraceae bacterium]